MTRIDFYILKDDTPNGRERTACRLVEKVYPLGHEVYINTDSRAEADIMDDLLWTYKQASFIPHSLYNNEKKEDSDEPKIQIGHNSDPNSHMDILINLSAEVPLYFSRFERVAEVIEPNDSAKKAGRERYSFYRDRGYALKTHEI
ncbi:MAG: DNA polymerase III subunit chi [Gammaproteobacteria bacterium]